MLKISIIDYRGYEYILNNLSKMHDHSDPHDIMFYNIYASNMVRSVDGELLGAYDEDRGRFIAEGPYTGQGGKPRLRGEITRETPKYRDKPYRGITEENKQEKTGTIDIINKNQEEFTEAITEIARTKASIIPITFARSTFDVSFFILSSILSFF